MLRFLSIAVWLLLAQITFAQVAAPAADPKKPSRRSAISSRDTTAQTIARLDAYIAKARADWQVPGLAVAIVQGDEVLLSKGYGVLEAGSTQAVNEHTLFAIASNSKAFTAAALAMLVDEGKLQWDDHVSKYLPWLRLKDPLASNDLRVRDLLCHRSGLGTFSGDLLWWGTPYTAREVLERAVHLEPAAPFRAKYEYSNLMFIAAGEVIREVSGLSWHDFIRQRIFTPVGMNRSIVSVNDLAAKGNAATPHKSLPGGSSKPIPWMNWDAMGAAGGIISSVHDMGKWMQVQLRQGVINNSQSLFSKARSWEMWQAHMPIPISEGYRRVSPSTHFRAYGMGWSLSDYQGHKVVGHGGGYDGMYSQVMMIPEKQLGIVVLTNSMTGIGHALCYRIADAFLGAPERDWSGEGLPGFQRGLEHFQERIREATTPVVPGTSPSRPLKEYSATFRCPMYGEAKVEEEKGRLVLRLLPNPDLVADLEHLHYDTFIVRWRKEFAWFAEGTCHFVADARGRFTRMELDIPNDDLWFDELKFVRVE